MTWPEFLSSYTVGVDLASRFSAVVVLDRGGEVIDQFDSWNRTPADFVAQLTNWVVYAAIPPRVAIEDVPYGIGNQHMIKSVLRLQGYIMGALAAEAEADQLEHIFFMLPSTWQRSFEGVWKGGTNGARLAAERLGYTAPDLLEQYAERIPEKGKERTKARAQLRKSQTDYIDAYLIARYMFDHPDMENTSGVQKFYI